MKRIITHYFIPALAFLVLVSVIAVRCKKPTEGITAIVNTSGLFHYTVLIQVVDPSGNVPSNLTVTASGTNAASIYGLDGKKTLAGPAGIIALGVHPHMEPTAAAPLTFNISVTGPGYLPLIVPVTIKVDQKSQVIKASILNLLVQTPGVVSTVSSATATAGTVSATTTVTTPTTPGNPESTTITIPTGTKLQDASGNTINASSVSVTASNFNTSQPSALTLFPGGSLVATNITGGTASSAVLVPAGFVNVSMTAGGTPVKNFSAPITLSMTLDPAYKNPSTGAPLAVGNVVGIYSYSTDTGLWKFESNQVVGGTAGNLTVTFPTNHLTIYTAAQALALIGQFATSVNAPWFQQGSAVNITAIATITNGPNYTIYQQTFQLDDTKTFTMDNKLPVPTTTNPLVINFYSSTNQLLGTLTLTGPPGPTANVTLTAPSTNPAVTLELKLDCSQSTHPANYIPPPFYLLYKPTGQSAANYALLGQVIDGKITTTQLAPAPTAYDFKAVLGAHVKEVINHTVAENTSDKQTVGGTGFSGTQTPAQNKIDINSLCESF